MKKEKFHRLSSRLILICVLLAAVICTAINISGYIQYRDSMYHVYNTFAYEIAQTALADVDADALPGYLKTGRTDAAYDEMDAQLSNLCKNCNLTSIYICIPDPEKKTVANIFDARVHTAEDPSSFALGVVDPIGSSDPGKVIGIYTSGKRANDYFIRKTAFGYNTSAILPVMGSSGKPTALLVVDVPMPYIQRTLNDYLFHSILITVLIVALFVAFLMFYLKHRVVNPLRLIASEAEQFNRTENSLSKKLPAVRTHDEVQQLAGSVYQMEVDINRYIQNLTAVTAEKERIGAELGVAKHIQASMLPCIFPAFPERPELDIYATMTPAKEVGGDFYDFFLIGDDRLAMVMADVSGKGVPAALFMVIAKTLLKNCAQTGLSPKEVLEKVNAQLCESNSEEMFVTVWLGILTLSTGELVAANAGHEFPVLKRAGGSYELVKDKHGFVLAGMEGAKYREYSLTLGRGDRLFLYTDGVPEATDAGEQLYGTDRMLAALNGLGDAPLPELLSGLKADIDRFVGSAPQFDDITMLCMELKGLEPGLEERKFRPELEETAAACAFAEETLNAAQVPSKIVMQMSVAVDEIFSNIARYSGASEAVLACGVRDGEAVLRFTDDGKPYDPTKKEDPDITLSADERKIGGLGIFMVKKFADSMIYEYRNGKNVLTVKKRIG